MSEGTPRLKLPFIVPGQAQKELFHNEALTLIDAAVHAAVEASPLVQPPASPQEGQCWITAAGAGGAWAGKDHQLAMWSESGWRFVAPVAGMSVWNKAAGYQIRWRGDGWDDGQIDGSAVRIAGEQVVGERQPAVPSPSGGTTIDEQARSAIDAIIVALMSHGLID